MVEYSEGAGPAPDEKRQGLSSDAIIEHLHLRLRREIIDGELAPGQTLSQVQLARRLGVSRTPLREAIRLLEREGLIESEFNRKVRVAALSMDELEEIYASRLLLEALAIRLTVHRFEERDIAFLEECLEEMKETAARQRYEEWQVPHRAFHARLRAAAGPRLLRQLNDLSDHAERYRRLYTVQAPMAWDAGIVEHGAIIQACRTRDPDKAADTVARHLAHVALSTVALLEPEYDPAKIRQALKMVLLKTSR